MPASAVSVKATYKTTPVTTYNLTTQVNGGHGTISASKTGLTAGSTETITFNPEVGYEIDTVAVNGTATSVSGNTLNVTMNENKTVVVTYKAIEYTITITDGKATIGAGTPITKATMGTTVILTANAAPSGKVFDKWEVVSGGITLADANSATTTFTMPASAVSVKATYKNAPHMHTYNQETVKPEALKTPADCTNNAVYFKSCSCGAISTTDTFVAMDTALGHAHGSDWKYDSTNHWHECSRCHDKKDEAAHDYGSDNVCDTCGYDKTVPHTHNLTLVPAKAATCTIAGNSAYYTCDGCDKWFADATGSVEITDKTSVKIPAPGHTAGTEWKSDDTNHWHECTVAGCGVIIESTKSAHTAGEWIVDTPATATTAGTKHKECTVCHRVLETQPIPSTGTELKIIAGDNQIYNKASGSDVTITCNGDFAKFTGIKVDGSVVDSSNYTAVSGSTVLTLKASYLGTLTDGSHTITFVYTDGEANANLTVRTAGSGHIHDYGTEWKSNADNHWHECNCGDKKDEAAHSFKWVVDKEATATKKGSKHEECKICGYKRSAVEIPATGTSTAPTDTTKPNDTTKPGNTNGSEKSPQTGDNSNIFLWFALLFVSAAGVTGITAYNKKKKEHAE
jgi:LPXTG-motif cell wall-anchored protein